MSRFPPDKKGRIPLRSPPLLTTTHHTLAVALPAKSYNPEGTSRAQRRLNLCPRLHSSPGAESIPTAWTNSESVFSSRIRAASMERLWSLAGATSGMLETVLREYVAYYNTHRPHRSLDQQPPLLKMRPVPPPDHEWRVRRRDRLGGLFHEYELAHSDTRCESKTAAASCAAGPHALRAQSPTRARFDPPA